MKGPCSAAIPFNPLKATIHTMSPTRSIVATLALLVAGLALQAQTVTPDDLKLDALGKKVDAVLSMAVQADRKILVGGVFESGDKQEALLRRLNEDGSLDTGFMPSLDAANPEAPMAIQTLAVQRDGKILAGGLFDGVAGVPRTSLARLNPDGSLDLNFRPAIGNSGFFGPQVICLLVQEDGRILVAGGFTSLGGRSQPSLGRLHVDGSLDTSFRPDIAGGFSFGQSISTLLLQPDGKILLGGFFFYEVNGQPREFIGRLRSDGTLDIGFDPRPDGPVNTLAIQSDGKLLVAGNFREIAGQVRPGLARLKPDGSIDEAFVPSDRLFDSNGIWAFAIQSDGRILLGLVPLSDNAASPGIVRLNQDGSMDEGFRTSMAGDQSRGVWTLALQRNGRILVGGSFTSLGGVPRDGLGRLINTGTSIDTVSRNGSTLTWQRGGTAPEVMRADFQYSLDGTSWLDIGEGTRVPGGWQRTGAAIPEGARTRVRGSVAGSLHGSNWFIETPLGTGGEKPVVKLSVTNATITLSWSDQPGTIHVQRSTSLIPPIVWQTIQTVEAGGSISLPLQTEEAYFRIHQP